MDDSSARMLPSTMSKSISLPQVRPIIRGSKLRPETSTSSVHANFAQMVPNDENSGGASVGPPEVEIVEEAANIAKSQRHVHFCDNLSPAVCRICHGGEISSPYVDGEPLISACHCSGTMGLYHRSCLEKWLSTSNRDKCEICKFQYLIERRPKPLIEFIRNPGNTTSRRNMIGDLICLFVLTPMAVASCWLCIAGALAVAETGHDAIAVPGLVSLAVFLIVTYLVWLSVSLRYHFQVWREWRRVNQNIRLITPEDRHSKVGKNIDDNNNDSPHLVQLQPLADIPLRRSTDPDASASEYESPWEYTDYRRSSSAVSNEYPNPAFVWETSL